MLKPVESVKQTERDLVEALRQRLEDIPFVSVGEVRLNVDLVSRPRDYERLG